MSMTEVSYLVCSIHILLAQLLLYKKNLQLFLAALWAVKCRTTFKHNESDDLQCSIDTVQHQILSVTHTHTTVSVALPNCRRNWSHLSTGWIPTLHQRMQKIGEHLDSGDDTSICAALVTGALQFLPCGGVRSAGHLPGCLAEACSTGDWALELKAWPCLSAQVPVP